MKKLFLSLIGLSFMAVASSQGMPFPVSRVVTDTIHSDVLGVDRAYTVYLPKSFDVDSTRTYPVLYLLHGLYGDNNGWFRDQRANEVLDRLIYSGEADEMVVISPNAGGDPAVHQNGYFNIPGWAYEDFFFNELVPRLEKRYRAGGSRGRRAVAGLSMGGGGTTSYAQRHPDKFCAAYAMSALMDIPEVGAVPSKSPDDKIALLMPAARLCARCAGMWTAATMISCSTATSNSCRPCTLPECLWSSACATAATIPNTGTRPCTLACRSCRAPSTDNRACFLREFTLQSAD